MLRRNTFLGYSSVCFIKKSFLHSCSIILSNNKSIKLENETEYSNVTDHIKSKMQRRLLHQENHPLCIIKEKIFDFFKNTYKSSVYESNSLTNTNTCEKNNSFEFFDDLNPVVTVKENFENLLTPNDHPSRQKDESYYLNENELLRCHMTAHQRGLLENNNRSSLLFAGDVYRRDTIDSTHYPVFHQLDGIKIYNNNDLELISKETNSNFDTIVSNDMKNALENMVKVLFGNKIEIRWVDAYFPFTEPSWEMEILFNDKSSQTSQQTEWLEVLGCGIMRNKIINPNRSNSTAWAFGLGLERLAMILFKIPDIRLFWSKDERFLSQFKKGEIKEFENFSKYPPCYKDITFWIDDDFSDNSFYELVREEVGDIMESIDLLDHFTHPKTKRQSKCYRLNYRSMERSLTNEEVNKMQENIRNIVVNKFNVELR